METKNRFEKAIKTLEYDKVLEMLADCTSLQGAREAILAAIPETDPYIIRKLQRETSDAKKIMVTKSAPSFYGIRPVEESVSRAEKSAALTMLELLNVASLLTAVRNCRLYAGELGEDNSLHELFRPLIPNAALENKIKKAVVSEDQLADDASDKLFRIRQNIRNSNNRIRENMQKYITSASYSKFLQENIITIRNGRYVIPVKAEAKNEIKGLVHDSSSSGATLFIEPLAVVELNNEIKVLENEEQHEIERILYELSADCASFASELRIDYTLIVELAVIFARAELSYRLECNEPKISDKKSLDFIKARHPLLDRKKVVPVSVHLGGKFDTLVITGPNTGGKTVALKTIGLLSMMAQSGLHIPVDEGSACCIFDNILADIGDEQSIEQSLSTFSSHMTNIVSMLSAAGERSLVLFDELGAGTDPVEGAALAMAILEHTRKKGALCAATTHYAELKAYAIESEGVENASCEFDVDTLKPTYRLIIGAPGKSNAFLISLKLGLDEQIIEAARGYVSAENRHFEGTIERLEKSRAEMEALRSEAGRMKAETERMYNETAAEREKLLNAAHKELERARAEAARMIKSAKSTSDYVYNELDALKKKRDEEKFNEEYQKNREALRMTLRKSEKEIDETDIEEHEDGYELPRSLEVGDTVLVAGLNRQGKVLSIAGEEVQIAAGNIKMKTNIKKLRLVSKLSADSKKEAGLSSSGVSRRHDVKSEIDLRGQTGDDAWFMVDKYLDDLKMAGLHSASLIHGKGTGALRNALWKFLRADKRVASFRMGLYGEGDAGVTVVELK